MPSNMIKTPGQEKAWERAKGIVDKQYPELAKVKDSKDEKDQDDKDKYYALVTTIYKSVCKGEKYDCEVSEMNVMEELGRIEESLGLAEGSVEEELDDIEADLMERFEGPTYNVDAVQIGIDDAYASGLEDGESTKSYEKEKWMKSTVHDVGLAANDVERQVKNIFRNVGGVESEWNTIDSLMLDLGQKVTALAVRLGVLKGMQQSNY